ncbi:MAG TPA: FAD-dependent oxidoreductase [Microlunatus sp.]|nr:FAD-dependent oxidoreductase [Microlunatus sp.]
MTEELPRERPTPAELAHAELDVLVVGGGIVGAGVALDAVTRGLRVALVDAGDWGGGRSGRTSTLVHGGLVDIRRIGVPAVAALRRERDLLLDRTAPHLVRRVPLLVPLTGGPVERLAVGAGLSLYDAAAFSIRQPGVLPGHRQLPRRAVPRLAPSIAMAGVTGAVQLYEAQVDDARLTVAVVRTAMAYGTLAVARTPVRRLVTEGGPAGGTTLDAGGRVTGAELDDPVRGPVTVRARVVVLATGTELSRLLPGAGAILPGPAQPPAAVHLVLPRGRLRASTGLVLREGDRAVYVVPWGRHWIVGTTATWSEPDRLLAALNAHLDRPIAADAVESTFAGPAPLGPDGGRTPTVQVPVPGLVLVRGSGLAGYRGDAERAVDAAVGQIGGLHPPSTTTRVPLLGADGFTARWNQRHLLARRAGVHVVVLEHLLQRYGSEVDVLIAAILRRPELARPLPGAADYLAVEVWFGVVHEGATQLHDVLARRTRIAMETWDGGAEAAAGVAELMAAELGWDDAERSRQISSYLRRAAADR